MECTKKTCKVGPERAHRCLIKPQTEYIDHTQEMKCLHACKQAQLRVTTQAQISFAIVSLSLWCAGAAHFSKVDYQHAWLTHLKVYIQPLGCVLRAAQAIAHESAVIAPVPEQELLPPGKCQQVGRVAWVLVHTARVAWVAMHTACVA